MLHESPSLHSMPNVGRMKEGAMTKGHQKSTPFAEMLTALGVNPSRSKQRPDKDPAELLAHGAAKPQQARRDGRTGNGRGSRPPRSHSQSSRDVVMIGFTPAIDHPSQLSRAGRSTRSAKQR